MRRIVYVGLGALVLLLGIAACGGNDSDDPGAGSATGAETEAGGGSAEDQLRQTLACDESPTPESLVGYQVPEADEEYDITLMQVSLAGYYYQGISWGAEQAASDAGVKLTTVAAEGYATPELQLQQVENAIQRGTDALVMAPSDIQGSVPVVEAANEAGIPVINISTEVASPDVIQVMQDDYIMGQLAADRVAEVVPDGGKGIVIAGPANATWSRKRTLGFKDRVAEAYPNIEIVAEPTQLVDPAQGLASFENAIQANPDIDWIYSVHYFILQPASLPPDYKGKVPYVSNGYEPDSITALEDGSLESVFSIQPVSMGRVGVGRAVEALNGEEPVRVTCLPAPVFTADDIGSDVANADLIEE